MAENKDAIIVAIELGTSRISGIAGKRVNGNMQILAYAEEKTSACIKRGIVYNIDQTTQAVKNVIAKLETTLDKSIAQVYMGLGGQSVRSISTKVSRDMMTQAYITAAHIEELTRKSYDIPYADCERLATFVQGYTVDGQATEEPVGVMGVKIEGEYLNIIARRQLRTNIETCFSNTDVRIADTRISAYELASNVLTDQEKRAGSVLVDLGAGTTTVVIYKNNIIRHLVTLPIGMSNIIQDLTSLQIDEKEAEQVMLKYGQAYVGDSDEDAAQLSQTYTTSFDKTVKVAEIQQIIDARLTEIIINVENQIRNVEYHYQLLGSIVLTGGGSNMKNIDKVFTNSKGLKIDKVRIARTLIQPIIKNSTITNLSIDNGQGNSIISLLLSGEENCVGEHYSGSDIFKGQETEERIAREKKAAEEEAQKEADLLAKLEEYKDAIRTKITEVSLRIQEIEENSKDKGLRTRAENLSRTALDIMGGEDLNNAIKTLEQKDKYKQTIKEAKELMDKLSSNVKQLREAIEKARKENSWLNKLKGFVNDIAED